MSTDDEPPEPHLGEHADEAAPARERRSDEAEGEGFPTPSSLRDVDGESNLYLVRI